MTAVDTSVVVAAFASWHEGHAGAAALLESKPRLPAHVLLETYSVLTRLPAPHRASAEIVESFLSESFPSALMVLPARGFRSLVSSAAKAGITGGSIYDALIAATAKHARAVLLTRDRRALLTYEKIGVRYEVVA